MTDEEMLRLASKAVGYTIASTAGAALKLATDLQLTIEHNHPADAEKWVVVEGNFGPFSAMEDVTEESNRLSATCRAIVRCAAKIGKDMET